MFCTRSDHCGYEGKTHIKDTCLRCFQGIRHGEEYDYRAFTKE